MAAHGYLVYLVRAGVPHRPRELYRLSKVGTGNGDAFKSIYTHLASLNDEFHSEDFSSEGFRVKELRKSKRTLWILMNKGPFGARGEAYDTETGDSIPTKETQALLSGLRAMFFLPKDSFYGLLFVEKIGRRHLKEVLWRTCVRPVGVDLSTVMRLEGYAEDTDWRTELSGKQALRISEVLVPKSSADDASTVDDTVITVAAEGSKIGKATNAIMSKILDRVIAHHEKVRQIGELSELAEGKRAAKGVVGDGFSVQDEAEYQAMLDALKNDPTSAADARLTKDLKKYVPVNRKKTEHKSFSVVLGDDHAERTFAIERDAVPQFVYETGKRLDDTNLEALWRTRANSILQSLGMSTTF